MITRTTLADLRTFVYDNILGDRSATPDVRKADQLIKEAHYTIIAARNWHYFKSQDRIPMQEAITQDTASVTASATSGSVQVDFSGPIAGLASGALSGQYIQFPSLSGQQSDTQRLYTIQDNTTSGVTLVDSWPFRGGTTSGEDFSIYRTVYDLPDNIDTTDTPWEDNFQAPLQQISFGEMLGHMRTYGVYLGGPFFYALFPNPVTKKQALHIWPAVDPGGPSQSIDLTYWRIPDLPTADTDVLDWPEEHMDVMWKAIMWLGSRHVQLGDDHGARLQLAAQRERDFEKALARWRRKDFRTVDLGYVGRSAGTSKHLDIRLINVQV